jgi:hypothetical protein
MNLTQSAIALTAAIALILAGCDRGASQAEARRLAEERAALEREKAALTDAKVAAREAANDQERQRLEAERAELIREKDKLAAERAAREQAEQQARSAAERDARMAAERRAEDEAAARREAEAREREARENTEESRTAQTVEFFYDALDPYGEWIELERYGYAFRPNTNQIAMWRPYTDGGWVYTEYGWTWRSNEPFGWATYHYGRWAKLPRLGWVWIPGTEWGPAWVSWRRSSDYIGWAPLPPDAWSSRGFNAGVDSYYDIGPGLYTFLRVADFGEPTCVDHVIEPDRNIAIINNTVNITKTVYKTVNNKTTIVNEGPDLTVINKEARRPVQQLKVQRVNTVNPRAAKVEPGMLQVVAPELKKFTVPAKPRQIKESVKAAEVDRGWKEAKAETVKVRAEAAKEAREAEAAERSEAKATPVVKPAPAPAPAPAAPPVPGAEPLKPERPAKPIPKFQPKPITEPAAEKPARPGGPPPVEPPKDRPGKPKRPGLPIPEPGTSPAVPPASPEPVAPNPSNVNAIPPAPGVQDPGAPGREKRLQKPQDRFNQFKRQNAQPTPLQPEATPTDNLRPGRKLKKDPAQEGAAISY